MSEKPDKESKTEQPTEKRIKDALDEGRVPFARELPALATMSAIWLAIVLLADQSALRLVGALRVMSEHPHGWRLHRAEDLSRLLVYIANYVLGSIALIVLLLSAAGLAVAAPQSRGFVLKRIKPEFSRISPSSGLERLLGRAGWLRSAKELLKFVLIGGVALWLFNGYQTTLMPLYGTPHQALMPAAADMAARLLSHIVVAFAVVAAADLGLSHHQWRQDLRMTRQEVKDEMKNAEGDPQVKLRARLIARQRIRKRMMATVPTATMVIANPTHFAVALRYVRGQDAAPRVVAKGQDHMALKIRAIATQHGVPVVEDRGLARSLFDSVPVDATIPPDFYHAIAKIILFLNQKSHAKA